MTRPGAATGPSLPWRRSLAFQVAIVVVAMLAVTATVVGANLAALATLDGATVWVNRAGLCRKHTSEMVYLAARAAWAEPGPARERAVAGLREQVGRMERALGELREGDPATGLPAAADPAILASLESLERDWRFDSRPSLARIESLASADARLEALERLDRLGRAQVGTVQEIVDRYEAMSQAQVRRIRWMEVPFGVLVVVVSGLALWRTRALFAREQSAAREAAEQAERRRAEEALRHERDYTAALFDTVGALVVVLDREGRIERFNHACEEATGYRFEEVRGRAVWDFLLRPEDVAPVRAVFAELRAGSFPSRHENDWVARDGRRRRIAWSNAALLGPGGEVEHVIATGLDITEREEMSRKLVDQASLVRLGEMAAVVAHEVRNALGAISSSVQLLGGRFGRGSREGDLVRDVRERVEALNRVVGDILAYARPAPARPVALSVLSAVRGAVAALQRDPEHAGVLVGLSGPDATVRGDAALLQQALLNLLMNAAQATQGRGTIAVSVSGVDGRCRLSVSDNGPGIPPEARARLFQPFFTTKARGTGLGLAIVKRVVELHGGTVAVECPVPGGTTVTLELPTVSEPGPAADAPDRAKTAVRAASPEI
ncbi:MAG: ATP-binding protein [Planctomycetales bacterium]|nr:ATP-binding protein [Planctomycetales bacterium]